MRLAHQQSRHRWSVIVLGVLLLLCGLTLIGVALAVDCPDGSCDGDYVGVGSGKAAAGAAGIVLSAAGAHLLFVGWTTEPKR